MLSAEKVVEDARVATGLGDTGDESFRDGLAMLVRSANAQARFNERGLAMFHGSLVSNLSNRMWVEHWYALHPEIDEQQIVEPLFGLGLPRTGSTALACTLAEDPAVRSIRMWETMAFDDPPAKETEFTDPRIEVYEQQRRRFDHIAPRMKTMVPVGAQTIVECHPLMGMDFKAQEFVARARLPEYVDWILNEADLVPTYRYMKRALKLLQWRFPPVRWRLKSPSHMPFVSALNTVFPDAKFWMTHRDITKVIPSVVDVYHELHKSMTDELDPDFIIDTIMKWFTIGTRRVLEFRNHNESRFVDIQFSEFQRDPEASVRRVYGFMGEDLSDEALARMRQWRIDQARGKDGKHEYDTIAAGLDLDRIREEFRFYSDRFTEQPA